MQIEAGVRVPEAWSEPTVGEIAELLRSHVTPSGAVLPGVAEEASAERGWRGRLIDVLAILTQSAARMGYLAGGRKPDEVATWLSLWADSPFSVEEIRTIVNSGGWDPEPFTVVVESGLLDRFVRLQDGSLRHVQGELAGAWLSDRFALAEDEEILREVNRILAQDEPPCEVAAAGR